MFVGLAITELNLYDINHQSKGVIVYVVQETVKWPFFEYVY